MRCGPEDQESAARAREARDGSPRIATPIPRTSDFFEENEAVADIFVIEYHHANFGDDDLWYGEDVTLKPGDCKAKTFQST